LEALEGEPQQTGIFERLYVVFDVGVGAHRPVEFGRVSVLVGVVTPEAVFQIGEEGLLGSGVERFAADDQAGAVGSLSGLLCKRGGTVIFG
jgi:hypothetical protein